jgi:hypothetical protein
MERATRKRTEMPQKSEEAMRCQRIAEDPMGG